jgi:chemotaxis protein MotB
MSDGHGEITIIKKKVYHGGGHHGGAWKIAFADFMTAMMAFFLVLWIINATDKDTRTVIARYFNPVKLENPARARKGVHGVDTSKIVSNEKTGDQAPGVEPGPTNPKAKDDKPGALAAAPSVGMPPKKDEKPKTPAAVPHPEPQNGVDVKPTMSETALFSDPYQSLDRILEARSSNEAAAGPDTGEAEPMREAGANSIEAFRDPFKPIGPGAQNDPVSLESDVRPPPRADQRPDIEPQKGERPASPGEIASPLEPTPPPSDKATPTPEATAAPESSAASAAVAAPTTSASSPQAHASSASPATDLMKQLQQQLAPLQTSALGPAIEIEATKEGLLISLTDKMSFSMFAIGSAEPRAEVIKAMETIAGVIKTHPEALVVRGHTDGRQYKTALYDNWRLSSARAQMAYYMLTRAGVPEARILRIEGHADHDLRDPAHPLAAENRRIEILLREAKP